MVRLKPRSKLYDLGYVDGFASGMLAASASWLLVLVEHPPALTVAIRETFAGTKALVEEAEKGANQTIYAKRRKEAKKNG